MPTLKDVYAKYGEVAEAAQLLETKIGNMVILHFVVQENLVENKNPERAAKIISDVNKKTFGRLLQTIASMSKTKKKQLRPSSTHLSREIDWVIHFSECTIFVETLLKDAQ